MQGYIRLYRKIRESPIFNDMQLFRLWMICLTEATHKERNQIVGRQTVKLMPGQFVTGRFDLQGMYNRGLTGEQQKSPATVWRWIEVLEKGEYLSIKSSNKFSTVSILNWHKYQFDEQQNEQQVSNKRATSEQQVSTNNNVLNDLNDNNTSNSTTSDDFEVIRVRYRELHGVLDLPIRDSPLLTRLLDEGILRETIIGVMESRFKSSAKTLGYYEAAIREAHQNITMPKAVGGDNYATYRRNVRGHTEEDRIAAERDQGLSNIIRPDLEKWSEMSEVQRQRLEDNIRST